MILSMSTETQFRVKYDGEDENYHELDAVLLSQALMGFSEMGRIAYRIAYPEETHTLNVRVKALESGSFEVALEAVVPALEHLYGQLVGLFNRDDAQAAAAAGGIGGLIAGAFKFIKWVGGRSHTAKKDGDTTTVTTKDGDSTTVPSVVYDIAGDALFIQYAGQSMAPLDDPKYDRMGIRDAAGNELDVTHEDDRGYFRIDGDEREFEESVEMEVGVESPQIGARNKMWTFRTLDGKFNARVEDINFLNYVENEGFKASLDTRLKIVRKEVRKRFPNGESKSKFYVLQVLKIIAPGEEPKLF